jgi:hydroxymethylglutaryl-CoA reductase
MNGGSRIPGFYRLPLAERLSVVSERSGVDADELFAALDGGGLDALTADKVVENVLGVYGLPFGVALNVRVNDRDRLVPMVVEEPSVIAAASNAARMIREGGGFRAEMVESLMTGQVELIDVPEPAQAKLRIEENAARLLALGAKAVPNLVARGGGPRSLEVRELSERCLVVHVYVDCCDAMGANLVNTIAEALGPALLELTSGTLGLRILSNLCDRRRVRVRCSVPAAELSLRPRGERTSEPPSVHESELDGGLDGSIVADRIALASHFAERDPYRAATHNKGIMNGVDAVVIASGNDFRAVEAGAHAYAARSGRYAPLAVWRSHGDRLEGELEMPLALGIVGGTLRVHPTARLALRLMHVTAANELAMIAASVGLASNLAALRALATEGIQRGHMSLHARSVAVAAGAKGDEVERVARAIAERGSITVDAAARALELLRT